MTANGVGDPQIMKGTLRQVGDLPRISMAEPLGEVVVVFPLRFRGEDSDAPRPF